MNNGKKFVGLSLALTVVFSTVLLAKTLLFSPRRGAAVKTEGPAVSPGAGAAEKRESPAEAPLRAPSVPEEKPEAEPEEKPAAEPVEPAEKEAGKRLNINTATAAELEALPGIGDYLAEAIIACREEMGGFKKTEDIMQVSGIGRAKYRALADLISVGE